ncbi:MAG: LysR family transcriptional regulator [Bacillota bacterium]
MTAKQLLFFKRTVELGNMTRAAEELLVSQPFLSRVIAGLEEELGVELFDRRWRKLALNAYGQALYRHVVNIFNEAEDAVKEIQDLKREQAATLKLVTNVSTYMCGLLRLLADSNPDVRISQYSAPWGEMKEMLLGGKVDFAICVPPQENCPELEAIELRLEPGVLIYPPGHWLEDYDEIDFDEIRDESFISGSRGYGTRDVSDAYMAMNNIRPNILIETPDSVSVFKFVASGLGVAFVPYSQAFADPFFREHCVKLKSRAYGKVALCWRREQYISSAGKLFIEKAREYFGNLPSFD